MPPAAQGNENLPRTPSEHLWPGLYPDIPTPSAPPACEVNTYDPATRSRSSNAILEPSTTKEPQLECGICFGPGQHNLTPCACDKDGSSNTFCYACLCHIALRDGTGSGPCPVCRERYSLTEDGNGFRKMPNTTRRQCDMCRQQREIKVGHNRCPACQLGTGLQIRYTCVRCNRKQMIPYPMYRTQRTPTTASTSSWACHQRCGDYTNWKVVPEDMYKIPFEDIPETWTEQREQWRNEIRLERSQSDTRPMSGQHQGSSPFVSDEFRRNPIVRAVVSDDFNWNCTVM